jgi:hypothetical protein
MIRPDVYATEKPKMAHVKKNQVLSFNAFCYDYRANAILLSEVSACREVCKVEKQKLVDEEGAKCKFALEKLKLENESKEKKYKLAMNQQEKVIKSLKSKNRDYLYFGAGILVGAIIAGATAYMVNK